MTENTAPALTIKNAGTAPATPRKLFVNIPVADPQKSIEFFEALGFAFNAQFTSGDTTCMLVGADAFFMLMTQARFEAFAKRPIGNPRNGPMTMFALSCTTRDEVDAMFGKALAAGGAKADEPQDHGFMYGQSFLDLDGYQWEVIWMDPAMVNG